MSTALEVLGLSLPYSASTPATYAGSWPCYPITLHPVTEGRCREDEGMHTRCYVPEKTPRNRPQAKVRELSILNVFGSSQDCVKRHSHSELLFECNRSDQCCGGID